ncbi:hypothetical protein PybrP1_008485 [[Pythium] brassicae (nom. inval.)]|nr:hypothetical protein PybrP1_008485 [[Pythium] brassicae (nom. inval.)]
MGMVCDADARGAGGGGGSPNSPGAGAGAASSGKAALPGTFMRGGAPSARAPPPGSAATAGMNAEETALILASLSKGQFGRVAFAAEDSDPEDHKHSDMEDLSDDDDDDDDDMDDDDDEHGGGGGAGGSGGAGSGGRVHRVQQINFDGPVGSKLDFTDDAGLSHRFRNESNRVKSLVTKHISIDELRAHFDRPIIDVAKDFGICITLMKKICRRNGIKRWPHRQIRSLSKSIASMEAAMLSTHGSEREKYRDQISSLRSKRESVIADPNKDNGGRPKESAGSSGGSSAPLRVAKLSLPGGQQQQQPLPSQPSQGHGFVPIKADGGGATYSLHPSSSTGATTTMSSSSQSAPPHSKGGRWTGDEHAAFLEGIRLYGKDWRRVAQVVGSRSAVQTRTHAQKYLLKFAGRFPFDAADSSGGGSASVLALAAGLPARDARAADDAEMPSPRARSEGPGVRLAAETGVRSPATTTTTTTTTATGSSRAAVEAMARILNSPASQASPREGEDVPMYSPVSASSAMGRALPSLAVPAIKMEQRKYESFVARDRV